jgi:hypothetical protein
MEVGRFAKLIPKKVPNVVVPSPTALLLVLLMAVITCVISNSKMTNRAVEDAQVISVNALITSSLNLAKPRIAVICTKTLNSVIGAKCDKAWRVG